MQVLNWSTTLRQYVDLKLLRILKTRNDKINL